MFCHSNVHHYVYHSWFWNLKFEDNIRLSKCLQWRLKLTGLFNWKSKFRDCEKIYVLVKLSKNCNTFIVWLHCLLIVSKETEHVLYAEGVMQLNHGSPTTYHHLWIPKRLYPLSWDKTNWLCKEFQPPFIQSYAFHQWLFIAKLIWKQYFCVL